MKQKYRFQFSVIMAVYNVEPYLREAVESVLAQDVGFRENVQLILVDDGSTDDSWKLCEEYRDEYPDNIVAVRKENGGASSARNEGLKRVEGRLINCLDPDDKLTENTLSEVLKFFEAHWEETDVVSIPLYYFEGSSGSHLLNYKFRGGTRLIDLSQEYDMVQLSISSAFVKEEAIRGMEFDTRLRIGEDAAVLVRILGKKCTLGAAAEGKYLYRKRLVQNSQMQTVSLRKDYYFESLRHFILDTIQYYLDRQGSVPRFVQYTMMYDLQWRLKRATLPLDVLSPEECAEYIGLLTRSLQYIDDPIILEQRWISAPHILYAFRRKYGEELSFRRSEEGQLFLYHGDREVWAIPGSTVRYEFLSLKNGEALVEGTATLFSGMEGEAELQARVGDRICPCLRAEKGDRTVMILGEKELFKCAFELRIPLETVVKPVRVSIDVLWEGRSLGETIYQYGKFSPVGKEHAHSYYCKDRKAAFVREQNLYFASCGRWGHFCRETAFLWTLLWSGKLGTKKAIPVRLTVGFLKMFRRRPIWLISDRVEKADDNGEAFFEYVRREHRKEVNAYFVLERSSSHYERLRRLGPVLQPGSRRYKILHLLADVLASSQGEDAIRNPFGNYMFSYRDIQNPKSFIFLQHGVTKDDLSGWLNRYAKNITGFVTAARAEWDSIVNGNYCYPERNIWLTGFPRFDRLYHGEKKCITIVPTWRKYLLLGFNRERQQWEYRPDFRESDFFRFYQGLLSSERLLSAAEKLGYRIQFMPHPIMRCCMELFEPDSRVRVLSLSDTYRQIYAESDLLLTDYSSTVFDFAYLRKPVVYCQFDQESFFGGGHTYTKGYFDYERDGFGEVEYDLDSTVERLVEYMENGCRLKEEYRERIESFFAYQDQESCRRVYDKIMELK